VHAVRGDVRTRTTGLCIIERLYSLQEAPIALTDLASGTLGKLAIVIAIG
jgi:hypothetical protein